MTTSHGMVTSPVRRGVLVLKRFLDDPPGNPPPNVPALDRVRNLRDDGLPLTPRERLEMHQEVVSCARCHLRIDPPGLALEHFDAIGQWHDRQTLSMPFIVQKGKLKMVERDIITAGTLAEGGSFADSDELKARLLDHQDAFVHNFIECLLVYALGREIQGSDRPSIDDLARQAGLHGHGLRTLVEAVVLSDLFRTK
jgi:hypothetical protein